jgi:D-mannonate dehydratase
MKVFLSTDFSEDRLKFAAQIGADGVSGNPLPGADDDGFYTVETLRKYKELIESHGLHWAAVRMAPLKWTFNPLARAMPVFPDVRSHLNFCAA